jgi:hypothetical protein
MDSGMFLPVQLAAARALIYQKAGIMNLMTYQKRRTRTFELLDGLVANTIRAR